MSGSLDIQNRPVLYYQQEFEASLFDSGWKIVTYLHFQQATDNVDVIGKYIRATIDLCEKHHIALWLNLTGCRANLKKQNWYIKKLGKKWVSA